MTRSWVQTKSGPSCLHPGRSVVNPQSREIADVTQDKPESNPDLRKSIQDGPRSRQEVREREPRKRSSGGRGAKAEAEAERRGDPEVNGRSDEDTKYKAG